MKKLFTLLTLLLCTAGMAWAEEAVLYYAETSANSITVNNFTIAITGNTEKKWTGGNGNITYGGTSYKTLKNSNGAQNTITCPSGKVATQIVFYVVTNDDSTKGKLAEIDGTTCSDEVSSLKDYSNPTVITKSIDSKSSFTFTFSTKQVCFIAVVTYQDASSDFVADPELTLSGSSLSMSCGTSGSSIYYTTDGTDPTTSSTLYSGEVTLENSCTVKAKAFKGESNELSSEIVTKDCYIAHPEAIAVLGYNGGSLNEAQNIWTSTDGQYVLTDVVEDRTIGYTNLAGSQDGFKLNHTDVYTIQVSPDVKLTKVVVVGKTWLAGGASTISFDDFTPTSASFYSADENRSTFINTVEFTPSSELDYGATITMRPGGNQLAAYIEIYGTKRQGPAAPAAVLGDDILWDFSSATAQAAAGTVSANTTQTLLATDGKSELTYISGGGDQFDTSGNLYYLKSNGTTNSGWTARVFLFQISSDGKLSLTSASNNGAYQIWQGSTTSKSDATQTATITTETNGVAVSADLQISNGQYVFIGFPEGKRYTQKIVWKGVCDKIQLTTTANMAGYRSFYDAEQGYTVDENTTVYVVSGSAAANEVTLSEISGGVPANTPVVLKTTADDRTMILTEATVTAYSGTNLLKATTANQAVSDAYRLGYGEDGIAFYKWNTSSADAGIVYIDKSDVTSSTGSGIRMVFGGVATGIANVDVTESKQNGIFNLQGQRVSQPTKGLYIVNGKKVLKK